MIGLWKLKANHFPPFKRMPYAESQLTSVRQAKAEEAGVQLDFQNGTLDEERENKTCGPPSGVRNRRRGGAAQVSLQGHG